MADNVRSADPVRRGFNKPTEIRPGSDAEKRLKSGLYVPGDVKDAQQKKAEAQFDAVHKLAQSFTRAAAQAHANLHVMEAAAFLFISTAKCLTVEDEDAVDPAAEEVPPVEEPKP
jgi:hypothetical protein